MKISVRNLEPTKVKLTVTVEPEELNPYLDAARKEIAKQVNVPGFRKGHVPGKIIDQRIGFAAVAGEAVNDAVPELYSKALDEKKIRPMAQPEFDVQDVPQSANDETKLKFTATVERRPDIELPEIDGLEIAISKPEVKDEDVDKRLETLRQRCGTLVGVDRPAAKGDFANIDLTAEIDGETVDSQEGVSYELGSNTMLDGLDEALDGLSAGEETTFEGTLEAGEHEGQKATVKVKVNSVKAEELPELNDEFASEVSEFETLDAYKEDVKNKLAETKQAQATAENENNVVQKVVDNAQMDIPAPMVDEQVRNMIEDYARRLQSQGISFDQYLQFTGSTIEQLQEQMRPQAELRLRTRLVLEAVVAAEKIEPSDELVEAEIKKMSENYKMDAEQIKTIMGEAGMAQMKADMAVQEAVDFLVAEAKLV